MAYITLLFIILSASIVLITILDTLLESRTNRLTKAQIRDLLYLTDLMKNKNFEIKDRHMRDLKVKLKNIQLANLHDLESLDKCLVRLKNMKEKKLPDEHLSDD